MLIIFNTSLFFDLKYNTKKMVSSAISITTRKTNVIKHNLYTFLLHANLGLFILGKVFSLAFKDSSVI